MQVVLLHIHGILIFYTWQGSLENKQHEFSPTAEYGLEILRYLIMCIYGALFDFVNVEFYLFMDILFILPHYTYISQVPFSDLKYSKRTLRLKTQVLLQW